MTPKSSYVLVGLFVLLLGVALIGGVLWLSTGGPPKDYEYYLVYMTESVSGLSIDAPVKYKGVNVGRVRDIRLNPDNPEEVRLLLVVQQGTPVNAETRATLEVQGLTGVANINLSGGGPNSSPLLKPRDEPYPVIESAPSLFARLDTTISDLLGNLIETTDRLNTLLDADNRVLLEQTMVNIEAITSHFAEHSAQVGTILDDMSALLVNARVATDDLPDLIARLQQGAESFEIMAQTFTTTGQSLSQTSQELQHTVSASGQDLRSFTAGTLPETSAMVADLRATARNLRIMSEKLQNDPSMLLFGPPRTAPGPGE